MSFSLQILIQFFGLNLLTVENSLPIDDDILSSYREIQDKQMSSMNIITNCWTEQNWKILALLVVICGAYIQSWKFHYKFLNSISGSVQKKEMHRFDFLWITGGSQAILIFFLLSSSQPLLLLRRSNIESQSDLCLSNWTLDIVLF